MRSKTIALLFVVILCILMLFASCGMDGGQSKDDTDDYTYDIEETAIVEEEDSGVRYVSNIILVYFEDDASESDKNAVVSKVNGEIVGRLDTLNQYQIKIDARSFDELQELCSEIEAMDTVAIVEIDKMLEEDILPYYPSDGYSDNWDESDPAGQNWGQEAIFAPYAWGYGEYAEEVPVGIVDSGFDTSHDDLLGVLSISSASRSASAEPDHGTFVAGIIGAESDNNKGISGMAPNSIMTGYSIGKKESTSNELIGYVVQAVKDGNKVINLSYGGSGNLKDCYSICDYNGSGRLASLQISRLLDQGYDFLVVQSAGNGAKDKKGVDTVYNDMFCSITRDNCYSEKHSYSEIISHVIIVAAAERKGNGYELAPFSNGGANVTLCAPGSQIYGLTSGGGCDYKSGTSFSAPLVAGTAAFIWGLDNTLSSADVKSILCDTCSVSVPVGPGSPSVSGSYDMIDAGEAAFRVASKEAEPEPKTADEAFQLFLTNSYESADWYYQDLPVFYDRDDYGNILDTGGHTWIEYAVADFDGDGQDELLLYLTFYTGQYVPDGPGSLILYEWEGEEVKQRSFCYFKSDLHGEDLFFFDNLIIYDEKWYDDGASLALYMFDESIRSRFGLYDGQYVSYNSVDGDFAFVDREICSAFSVDDITRLTNEEYIDEYDSIMTGNHIEVDIHPVTSAGIYSVS